MSTLADQGVQLGPAGRVVAALLVYGTACCRLLAGQPRAAHPAQRRLFCRPGRAEHAAIARTHHQCLAAWPRKSARHDQSDRRHRARRTGSARNRRSARRRPVGVAWPFGRRARRDGARLVGLRLVRRARGAGQRAPRADALGGDRAVRLHAIGTPPGRTAAAVGRLCRSRSKPPPAIAPGAAPPERAIIAWRDADRPRAAAWK